MKIVSVLPLFLAAALAGSVLSSCASMQEDHAMQAPKSLYERLGGKPAITAVVDDFVARAASNPKVNFTRKGTSAEWPATPQNVAHMRELLVQLVCSVSGGPEKYEGRPMKSLHAGMQITGAEFDALAGDLIASLKHFNVPEKELNELIAIVATTRGDIVTRM